MFIDSNRYSIKLTELIITAYNCLSPVLRIGTNIIFGDLSINIDSR